MKAKTFFKSHPIPVIENIQYYDHEGNWRRVQRHLKSDEVQAQMVMDLQKFTWGRWRKKFTPEMLPCQVDNCDWRLNTPGSQWPAYWKYVTSSASHWVVNFNLLAAQRVERERPWRILTSPKHSTVWDGDRTLFDLNFCALGVSAPEAFALATRGRYAEILELGQLRKVHYPEHYTRVR